MKGKKRDHFPSWSFIAPPAEMSISLRLVCRGGGRKNNPQPKTPDWSETGVGDGGISQKTPKSIGGGGENSHPLPNTHK